MLLALAYYSLSLFPCSGQTVSLCFSRVDFSLTLSASYIIMPVVFLSELFELFTQPFWLIQELNNRVVILLTKCKIVFAKWDKVEVKYKY